MTPALSFLGWMAAAALLALGVLGPLWRPSCPGCRAPASRVIHWGVPVWFCFGHEEALTFGIFSWLLFLLPFTGGGLFVVDGPYLPGLWRWLHHQ